MSARSRSRPTSRKSCRSPPSPASPRSWSASASSSWAAGGLSPRLKRPGEADGVLGESVENDLHAARFHHPFQPVIAIFAADLARRDALGGIAHGAGGGLELLEGLGDRRALADAPQPARQR